MGMSQEGMHKTNHLYKYTRCYNDILLYMGVLHLHYIQAMQYIIMIFLTGYVLTKPISLLQIAKKYVLINNLKEITMT